MNDRARALGHFRRHDPRFYAATRAHHGALPLTLPAKRTTNELFSALVSIVVSQQLGTAAADSIFARVLEACGGGITAESALRVHESALRAAGLSGAKIKAIKLIAQSVKPKGSLDLLALKRVPEAEATEALTALWGLGPWSVEMFMMFALGRADVFSSGDLGLARSIEQVYGLPKDAPRASLLAYSEKWSPHRTWACLLLWRLRDRAPSEEALRRARRTGDNAPPPTTKGRHR
jgi:DNA-3-methyladenine glycosylase II